MATYLQNIRRTAVLLSVLVCALAASASATVLAQNVTQGYQSDQVLQKGMIVRLKPDDGKRVQALTQTDGNDMLGVIVASNEASLSLSTIGVDEQAFVATYGRYDVLVSDQNGAIKNGDMIVISSLAGVGMRANSSQQLVIGKALRDFTGQDNATGQTTLETSTGKRTVRFGRIPVEIAITRNPLYQEATQPGVPKFLARIVSAVTDRPVSPIRIYAGVAILFICIIIAAIMLFAGVRSGMISVGRNPLAKRSIMRNMVQVTLMALIVFVIGVIAVYLVLRV